jgi:hypothetical protein
LVFFAALDGALVLLDFFAVGAAFFDLGIIDSSVRDKSVVRPNRYEISVGNVSRCGGLG